MIVSIIFLMVLSMLSCGSQTGWLVTLNAEVPNSSIEIFKSFRILKLFLMIKNSFIGSSMTIGIRGVITLLVG